MANVALFIKTRVQGGKRKEVQEQWESHLKDRAMKTDAQKVYFFCHDNEDENVVCIFELYDDPAVLEENGKSQWFTDFMEKMSPHLDGWPEVTTMTPVWAKNMQL